MTTTVGSLFSGYGGLDLALSFLSPVRTAWVADIEPGPRRVLARRFPDAPNLGDVTTVDWGRVEPVDVITGGSPCQDLSTAGRRGGHAPGHEVGALGVHGHSHSPAHPAGGHLGERRRGTVRPGVE